MNGNKKIVTKRDSKESKSNQKSKRNKKNNRRDVRNYNERQDRGSSNNGKFPQESVGDTMHDYNDASWYAKNSQALNASASFSYNTPLGAPLRYDRMVAELPYIRQTAAMTTVPGLMSLHLSPTIGISTDYSSPANVAAQNIYSFVRYANSGSRNYDAPDLMLYLLAMDSVYSCWNWMKRLYGCVNSYSQLNRYMPRAYVQANGVDFDDLIGNLADFRAFLDNTGAKISAFCVPAVMNYFVRHSWLYSNIYKDSDTLKAQQYIFVPSYFYQYDETTSADGGILSIVPVCYEAKQEQNLLKVSEIESILTGMLNALQYSEDIGVMSGDILKAYGENQMFKLSPIDANYSVTPVYNEEVLNQIHNCTLVAAVYQNDDLSAWSITQDPNTNWLLWNPSFSTLGAGANRQGALINMPWENPTPENTMVGSRLVASTYVSKEDNLVHFSCVGSDYVNEAYIWMFSSVSQGGDLESQSTFTNLNLIFQRIEGDVYFIKSGTPLPGYDVFTQLHKIQLISNFDWHPLVTISYRDLDTPLYESLGFMGDMNTYTIIGETQLEAMNLTALLSMFGVPQIGPSF